MESKFNKFLIFLLITILLNSFLFILLFPQIISFSPSNFQIIEEFSGSYIDSTVNKNNGDFAIRWENDNFDDNKNVTFTRFDQSFTRQWDISLIKNFIPVTIQDSKSIFMDEILIPLNNNFESQYYIFEKDQLVKTGDFIVNVNLTSSHEITKLMFHDEFVDGDVAYILFSFDIYNQTDYQLYSGVLSFNSEMNNLSTESLTKRNIDISNSSTRFILSKRDLSFTSQNKVEETHFLDFVHFNQTTNEYVYLLNYEIMGNSLNLSNLVSYNFSNLSSSVFLSEGRVIIPHIDLEKEIISFVDIIKNDTIMSGNYYGNQTSIKISKLISQYYIYYHEFIIESTNGGSYNIFSSAISEYPSYNIIDLNSENQPIEVYSNPNNYQYYSYNFVPISDGYLTIIQELKNSSMDFRFTVIGEKYNINSIISQLRDFKYGITIMANLLIFLPVIYYSYRRKVGNISELYP